ncbi:MAG: four helix bundle protein [Dysgonamonadaceae bacterium]|jgi:four helix bundle protein|nr:four helix bundle protein [Dysgonamonadaceae bacterium]
MKRESILREKSYAFAIRIVKLCGSLCEEKKEFVLSKQLLRSGTSPGALAREAEYAQSKADFINKLHVALKEANETAYWLQLLKDTDYLEEKMCKSIYSDCDELISILVSSLKTLKNS